MTAELNRKYFTKSNFNLRIICLVLCLITESSLGQNYKLENLTVADGLADGCIQYIMQDSKGFMWFATEGGLNRYDGYNIKLYDCGEKFIAKIFEDPADSGKVLWIGTRDGGLIKFDREKETFQSYRHNLHDSTTISANAVSCICKDKSGNYWIGTFGGGLNQFDRNTEKFISYKNNPADSYSISSDIINTICEDYLGNLWIGTEFGGLDRFDRQTNQFIHYNPIGSDPSMNSVSSLFEDSDRTLWIGANVKLFKYDREHDRFIRFKLSQIENEYHDGILLSITEDKNKRLWIASNVLGAVSIGADRKNIRCFSKLVNNTVLASSVCVDRNGIIWVGTFCEGITKIIPNTKYFNCYSHFPSDTSKRFLWTFSFYEDEENCLWIGSIMGIKKWSEGKFVDYPILTHDVPAIANRFYRTNTGKLLMPCGWCLIELDTRTDKYTKHYGKYLTYLPSLNKLIDSLSVESSEIAGLTKVKNNQRLTKDFAISEKTNVLIFSLGEGNLTELFDYGWITSENSNDIIWRMIPEKSKFAGGEFKNRCEITFMQLEPGNYQLHYISNNTHAYDNWIEKSPTGPDLWGISVFPITPSDYRKYQAEIEKPHYLNMDFFDLNELVEDEEGKIWCLLLTEANTLHQFDRNSKQFFPFQINAGGNSYPKIIKILKDKSGILWFVSTDNKLIRRNNDGSCEIKFSLGDFTKRDESKLNYNAISQIYEDSKNNFWIGTDLGLFKYKLTNDKIDRIEYDDFKSPPNIRNIIEDNSGKLWISTNHNLTRFDPLNNSFRKYDSGDGLPVMSFAANSCCRLRNGQLAFGGSNGFIIFDPDSIKDDDLEPLVELTDFQLFNKTIIPGDNSVLKRAISGTDKIVLDYDQDVFTVEFTALDFTDPLRNNYAYKMEGVDPDWVHTGADRRFATYTKLNPGEYLFGVKGSNSDAVWNEKGKSILFIITPPWWKTTWAYIMYSILILSIIYITWKMQVKRIGIAHEFEMTKFEADKMHEVDQIKSRFFANISHEFRTPLTMIIGPVKQIIERTKETRTKEDLLIVQKNAGKLLSLVNQLLDLSKVESGNMKLSAAPHNVVFLLKALLQFFHSYAERKKITLKFNSADDEIIAYIDKDKFEKIITNILSNAFKFTPEGGQIEISVKSENEGLEFEAKERSIKDFLEISICDTGIGIPREKLPRIFDRFYQADGSHTREQEGTGIGLSLTKELVELHKGRIEVESEEGKGTTVKVSLPLGKVHLKAEEICEVKEETEAEIEAGSYAPEPMEYREDKKDEIDLSLDNNNPVLLVVEDNADVRNYIKDHLMEDYRILEAVDGEEGWNRSIENIPDLIVSDIMMPKMDGFELCGKIKTDERTSHIPVILLTAKAASSDKIEGYETGADDYIMKPFEPEELKARIKNLIVQRKRLHEHFRKHGLFEIDEVNITSVDQKFLQKAFEIINNNISGAEFNVESFSSIMAISRSVLYKKIVALTGESPVEFIRNIRLKKAAELLKKKFGNISEIALEVGFNNPAYFSECFKKYFGKTPQQYQRELSKES